LEEKERLQCHQNQDVIGDTCCYFSFSNNNHKRKHERGKGGSKSSPKNSDSTSYYWKYFIGRVYWLVAVIILVLVTPILSSFLV